MRCLCSAYGVLMRCLFFVRSFSYILKAGGFKFVAKFRGQFRGEFRGQFRGEFRGGFRGEFLVNSL